MSKLTILAATWGAKSNTDVKAKVEALMAKSSGALIIDSKTDFNSVFGDPEPGASKYFALKYQYPPFGPQLKTWPEKHDSINLPSVQLSKGGTLQVNVKNAIGLKEGRTFGKQNPYCKLTCGTESFKTRVHQKGGTNPEWNQAFVFNVDGNDTAMHILILDEEIGTDSQIARVDLPLSQLCSANGDIAYPVYDPKALSKQSGTLLLNCEFKDPNVPTPTAAATTPAATPTTTTVSPTAAPSPQQPQQQVVYMYQQPQQPQQMYSPQGYQQPQQVYSPQGPQMVYQQPQGPQVVYQQQPPQVVYQQQPQQQQQVVYQQQPQPTTTYSPPPQPTTTTYSAPQQQQQKTMTEAKSHSMNTKFYLTNATHKKQVTATPEGGLSCKTDNKQAWEEWTLVDLGNGKVLIKNCAHPDQHLGARPDGSIYVHSNKQEWEQWTVVNGQHFRSHHGSFLGAKPDGDLYAGPNQREWETWVIGDGAGGAGGAPMNTKVYLSNATHKKQVTATPEGGLACKTDNKQAWEEWTILDAGNGKILIKNNCHPNQHLGARPDGTVYVTANKLEWEHWTVGNGKGGLSFRSHHGSFLGAKPEGDLYAGPNQQEWEAWTVHRA